MVQVQPPSQGEAISKLLPWSIRSAETLLQRNTTLANRWHYEPGVALLAIQRVWERTADERYFEYIRRNMDAFVEENGNIRTYEKEEYNLDQINAGKVLFALHAKTGEGRYKTAAHRLRKQLETHPRTMQGGFWHKRIYPHQMWLDGLYMAGPFLTRYARAYNEPAIFEDVAHQIALFDHYARDAESGLLYHAWDSARSQKWANLQTGCSPNFWARAEGWFMMALVDILDDVSHEHPQRDFIIKVFRTTAEAVLTVQEESSGLWYQVLDQGARPGNYLEASASCMFVYALAKAIRLGYLDLACLQATSKGYVGILDQFIEIDESGWVNLHRICSVGGLGGNPYRDGSFEYYISEPVVSNDFKGFGPFILASLEIESASEKQGDQR